MSECEYCGVDPDGPDHDPEAHRVLKEQEDVRRLCDEVRAEAERLLTPEEFEAASLAAAHEATLPGDVYPGPFGERLRAIGLGEGTAFINWRVYAESMKRRIATHQTATTEHVSWSDFAGTVTWETLLNEYMAAVHVCEAYKSSHEDMTKHDGAVLYAMSGISIVWPAVRCALRDATILASPPQRPLVELILSATRRVRLTLCAQITAGQA